MPSTGPFDVVLYVIVGIVGIGIIVIILKCLTDSIVILLKWLVWSIFILLKWLVWSIFILLKWLVWSIVILLKWLMWIIVIPVKWLMPKKKTKQAEPEIKTKQAEPEIKTKQAEPEIKTKQAEPEIKTKQAEQEIESIDQRTEEASILGRITIELFEKPVRFSSKEIAASTRNYSTKLGSGGFGDVYKGEVSGGVEVAVKLLKQNDLEKGLEKQFIAEVGTIGRTYHINLVRLIGFCFENDIKALVYEYLENGSLDDVLFSHNRNDIKWDKLYDIAVGAGKGLEYLHHLGRQRIIHCDIKPGNILIDSKFCAKIADFGLAKLCNKDNAHTSSGFRGTPGYAAPELWMSFPVSDKCDVYSFGIMLFEIIGRKRNLSINSKGSQEWFPKRVWEKYEKGELEELIVDNRIDEKDRDKAKTMAMAALWCVQYLPEARPSMSSVVKILENVAEVIKPPNPFQHLMESNAELPQWIESCSISINSTSGDATFDGNGISSTPIMKKYEIGFASPP